MGIFSDIAPLYIESGLIVVPLEGKIPIQKNWTLATLDTMSDYASILSDRKLNVGLLCGQANNVIAIDLDSYEEYHEKLLSLFPPSPVRKVGKKGVTVFYRFHGEASRKFYVNRKTFCEILSTGNQTVLPPSVHPETLENYKWVTLDSLLDISPHELPELPPNYVELIESVVREIESSESEILTSDYNSETGRHNSLFSQIRAGIEKGKSPQDIAYEIYTYDASRHSIPWLSDTTEKPFRGVPRSQPQRLALTWVLYEYSKLLERDKKEICLEPHADLSITFSDSKQVQAVIPQELPREKLTTKIEQLALEAPGLTGEIVQWIIKSARVPQPALALGSALTVLGTLKAHRVATEDDLRTNHFIATLAESGSGKDHPLKCANVLLEQVGYAKHIAGDPASDAALLRIVREADGRAFISLDEIGLKMKALSHSNASTQEMAIIRALTSLWSSANCVFRGKEYANHDNRMQRKDINQPCVNIYGTTEPISFYKALRTSEMQGGFLPRWLILQISNPDAKSQRTRKRQVPTSLLEQLHAITDREIEYDDKLVVSVGVDTCALTPKPQVIPYTHDALTMLDELEEIYNTKKRDTRKLERGIDALWARGLEHLIKLSLTVCDNEINKKSVKWSNELVYTSLELATNLFLEHASESQHEERSNKILSIISKNPGITKRELIQRTRSLSVKERDDTLQALAQAEQLEIVVSIADKTKKKVLSYYAANQP